MTTRADDGGLVFQKSVASKEGHLLHQKQPISRLEVACVISDNAACASRRMPRRQTIYGINCLQHDNCDTVAKAKAHEGSQ